jgi:hypothetical protein
VLVVDDGPTLTHGGMPYGAGYVAAVEAGAEVVDPLPYAGSDDPDALAAYPHMRSVLPALGYGPEQLAALQRSIAAAPVEYVVSGTPIDLAALVDVPAAASSARATSSPTPASPRSEQSSTRCSNDWESPQAPAGESRARSRTEATRVLNLAVGALSRTPADPVRPDMSTQPLPLDLAALERLLRPAAAKYADGGHLQLLSLALPHDRTSVLLDCTMAGAGRQARRAEAAEAIAMLIDASALGARVGALVRVRVDDCYGSSQPTRTDDGRIAMRATRTGKDGGSRRRIAPPVLRDGKAHCPRCGARLRLDYGVFACISCGYTFEAEPEQRQWIEEPSTGHAA